MPKPNCTADERAQTFDFGRLGRRVVEGRFDGGRMTSDGGVMLLGASDRKLGLIDAAARCIADPRNPLLIIHAVRDMLRPSRTRWVRILYKHWSMRATVARPCSRRSQGAARGLG